MGHLRQQPSSKNYKIHFGKLIGAGYKRLQVWTCLLFVSVSFVNIHTFLALVSAVYLKAGDLCSLCAYSYNQWHEK